MINKEQLKEKYDIIYNGRISEINLQFWEKIKNFTIEETENTVYFVINPKEFYEAKNKNYKFNTYKTHNSKQKEVKLISLGEWYKLQKKIPLFENCGKSGIYALYLDEKLLYIGMTEKTFYHRLCEHCACIDTNNDTQKLYIALCKNKISSAEITLKPLFIKEDAKIERITSYDLETIEYGFIQCFNPPLNAAGIDSIYYHKNRNVLNKEENLVELAQVISEAMQNYIKEQKDILKD